MMVTAGERLPQDADWQQSGTTFRLQKPVTPLDLFDAVQGALGSASSESADAKAQDEESPGRPTSLKILLVEDSLVNQKLAAAILTKEGHQVLVAHHGRDALRQLECETFDLILMDIQMPEMDGVEATRAIRGKEERTGQHIPIIALTAHALEGDRERFLSAGMDHYISKPIHTEEMLEVIEATMAATAAGKWEVA
jgi:CheY-like chemotaxis protein